MNLDYPKKEIIEGKARLFIPALDTSTGEPIQHLRSEAPVFYNPVMKTNRDTAVLVLKVHKEENHKSLELCEPMCGSGVRGIRIALEVDDVSKVVMGDLSPSAIQLASVNARINKVSEKISLRLLDANLLLSLHCYPGGRFDYVDIDPYGTPSTFLDNGIRSVNNHGIIALTATDMAPLCGVSPNACLRKYGGFPLQSEFCHEVALRLLTGSLVRQAAVHEIAATPIFSYYSDHYIRLYSRLDRGARYTDKKISQMGYIKYCKTCLHRETAIDNKHEKCPICGNLFDVTGPLWLGEVADQDFSKRMQYHAERLEYLKSSRLLSIIEQVSGEIGYPVGFYNIDKICSLIGSKSIATREALSRIRDAGYRVTSTHFENRGFRTDANIKELENIFRD